MEAKIKRILGTYLFITLIIFNGRQEHSVYKLVKGVDCIAPIAIQSQEYRTLNWITLNLLQYVEEARAKRRSLVDFGSNYN